MLEERTVYWAECDECGDCTPEFDTEFEVLRWVAANDWEVGERTLCPECRPDFLICYQCGRERDARQPHSTGYVRRADDGGPFDDWYDRWLVRDGEAWCPDHWHVECDECHVHESGHADALEYHGWRIGECTLCPECAKQPTEGANAQCLPAA